MHQSSKEKAAKLQTFLGVYSIENPSRFEIFSLDCMKHETVYNVHHAAFISKICPQFFPKCTHSLFHLGLQLIISSIEKQILEDLTGKWAPYQIVNSGDDRGGRN